MGPLDGKQLSGNRTDVLLVSAVDLVAPRAGLLIEIVPAGKLSSGQKVLFNKPERPLHAAGSIGIADLMGIELKKIGRASCRERVEITVDAGSSNTEVNKRTNVR